MPGDFDIEKYKSYETGLIFIWELKFLLNGVLGIFDSLLDLREIMKDYNWLLERRLFLLFLSNLSKD